ncbi:hypothetical protein ACFLZ5_04700 [Thermodesulfobacteriota bacterium]
MKKHGMFIFVISVFILILFQYANASKKDYYSTYEIIEITENGLTLEDSSGNRVIADKNPKDYKVGYKVRYDKIRKRLKLNRWQHYGVIAVSEDEITLKHKTGDTITMKKNYTDKYNVGDLVRYDSATKKLQREKDSGQLNQ